MRKTPLRRKSRLRSRPKRSTPEHRAATELAHRSACLLCEKTGTCVPAHFPHHRGRRGEPDAWHPRKWVPLCGEPGSCHDFIDSRAGGVLDEEVCAQRKGARALVLERAKEKWWPAVLQGARDGQ